jgi:hypothetical protein
MPARIFDVSHADCLNGLVFSRGGADVVWPINANKMDGRRNLAGSLSNHGHTPNVMFVSLKHSTFRKKVVVF